MLALQGKISGNSAYTERGQHVDEYMKETREAMSEVEDMIKNGTGKTYDSVEELFKELNS